LARILVVEDHAPIRDGVAAYLRQDGHEVDTRADGSGLAEEELDYHLLILDVMLPGRDGFSLARDLRSRLLVPFLFLTARGDEEDRIAGWELGAVDYVVKPFSPRELVLRVRSILRRTEMPVPQRQYRLAGQVLLADRAARRLTLNGQEVFLTPGEWSFLETFLEAPGKALSRKALMVRALDYYVDTGERTVDTHIKNLRAKLGLVPWIETVRGLGYRFAGDWDQAP